MFAKNDTVFYQKNGICEIVDISEKTISNLTKKFYVLRPINDTRTVVYIPCDSEALVALMKKILTKEEIEIILKKLPTQPSVWIEDRNARKEKFQTILQHGDCLEIITMLKTISIKREELIEKRKKLSASDDSIYREAEKMLKETFSYILNIPKENVMNYIFSHQ